MAPLSILIKPVSGSCNLRCEYCFYCDITSKREIANLGVMSQETLENIISKTLETATVQCTIAFQGGEPTLAGINFYKEVCKLQSKYNKNNVQINNVIQTNGFAIDEEWAEFFATNKFLVGLSLDGTKDINDSLRKDVSGNGSFEKIMNAKKLFDRYGVEYNILTVVTSDIANNMKKVHGFYTRNNLLYQQYIPCLDPIGEKRGEKKYSLTPKRFEKFLKTSFDLWYADIKSGRLIYNHYFENLVLIMRGYPPQGCGMLGRCSNQNVIEADGSVYPCDFYVLDQYKIGNINTDNFKDIDISVNELGFTQQSFQIHFECKECEWIALCNGGCKRYRETGDDGKSNKNYYCEAYKAFFTYAVKRLQEVSRF